MLVLLRRLLLMLISPKKLLPPLMFPCLLGLLFGLLLFPSLDNLRSSSTLHHNGRRRSSNFRDRNDHDLILVGVMTAQRFLDTRALQIWRSWGRYIPGRLIFFVAQGTVISTNVSHSAMPVVVLRGVDDSYPPQKKSFAMLRWMYDNQLANFHWFMRADDDLYVRSDRLKDFLLSLDPDKAHLLGQAGLGNSMEYGQLSLGAQDNYCMGGPGVILSRETLRQLAPHLRSCLGQLLTNHEDVELGRCIRRYVGVACPWNYEMQILFHNNASVATLYSGQLPMNSAMPLRRLISLHPIKQPIALRRIHLQAELLRLNKMRQRRMGQVEELERLTSRDGEQQVETPFGNADGALFSGLQPRPVPNSTEKVAIWEFISTDFKLLFCLQRPNCPRHTLEAEWRRALSTTITQLFDQFNANARERGRTLHFQTLQYGYVRVQPRFGVDLMVDMALWYRRFRGPYRTSLAVRRHAYVQQRFGTLQARALNTKALNTIHVVVALKGRAHTFARFAQNLVQLSRSDGGGGIQLVLVHYSGPEETQINASLAKLAEQHLPVRLVQMPPDRPFSRGEALSAGVAQLPAQALLLFADVDVLIRPDALQRLRLNTIAGSQVYFPIVFSEFSPHTWPPPSFGNGTPASGEPQIDHFVFDQRRGYFRHFGYGIVAIWRSDFEAVGGFNLSIQGWGLEDVDLFERIVKVPSLQLFRAPDPGLVHVYHPIECGDGNHQNQAQRDACEGSWAQGLGSMEFLAEQFGPYL